jgi:eukaryotic-like serine/threonine-protein kinase
MKKFADESQGGLGEFFVCSFPVEASFGKSARGLTRDGFKDPQSLKQCCGGVRGHTIIGIRDRLEEASGMRAERDSTIFKGNERFLIKGLIGSGAFGEVYLARDLESQSNVAIKSLHRFDATALALFKKEFRSLSDVIHPNLVQFFELFSDGEKWFFSMEYIEGVGFLKHAWAKEVSAADAPTALQSMQRSGFDSGAETLVQIAPRRAYDAVTERQSLPELNDASMNRLKRTLEQLAKGVMALHGKGMLHRDLKPSNVLVDKVGRVVLLDFGLVAELTGLSRVANDGLLVGTPVYMSPEQAMSKELNEASDWYSVGVMLYEALVGNPPFTGNIQSILNGKQYQRAPRVTEVVPNAPRDLAELCRGLLIRDPRMRKNGEDILRTVAPDVLETTIVQHKGAPEIPFVGREEHLESLKAAFRESQEGEAAVVYVHGLSGMGKSVLIQRYLDELEQNERAVILTGRCYQQESVPYKAWDPLIDSLATYLCKLSYGQSLELIPTEVKSLVRLFPVLRQVTSFSELTDEMSGPIADPKEVQRRAFKALRDLLRRLSNTRPLVLFIDDLQWGDVDSALLLEQVLRPPAPPFLLLGSYRSDEADTSPMLRLALTYKLTRQIEVKGLKRDEVEELAECLWKKSTRLPMAAEELRKESGGSPYFVAELIRYMSETGLRRPTTPRERLILDEMIRERVGKLTESAQQLLEVVALAGRPLTFAVVQQALKPAVISPIELGVLRTGNLIRTRDMDGGQEIESYHDRIRESVVNGLSEQRLKEHCGRLAIAMEELGDVDAEQLAGYFYSAGQLERTAEYALTAADRANGLLAFDRAARLYQLALDSQQDDTSRAGLLIKLGGALSNARRGLEGARVFLEAAALVEPARAVGLLYKAAHGFFVSGYMKEGMETTGRVLENVGMTLPDYGAVDQGFMVLRWLAFRVKGFEYVEKPQETVSKDLLLRIDACWSVASAMNSVDILASADFCHRTLVLALEAGEPSRVARGLGAEAYMCVNLGQFMRRSQILRSQMLVDQAMAIAERLEDPYPLGFTNFISGVCAFVEGRFRRGHELCEEAANILRNRCAGISWELDNAHCFSLWNLTFMGEAKKLCAQVPDLVKEAHDRKDLYALLVLGCINLNWYYLFRDEIETGADEIQDNLVKCDNGVGRAAGLHIWTSFVIRADQALYMEKGREGWDLCVDYWPKLVAHSIMEIQFARTQCWYSRGRCALAAAQRSEGRERRSLLREVERAARKLLSEPVSHARGMALTLRACKAQLDGLKEKAIVLLVGAERSLRDVDMGLHGALCRRMRGRLLGGDEGEVLIRSGEDWMASQEIMNPGKMSACLLIELGD